VVANFSVLVRKRFLNGSNPTGSLLKIIFCFQGVLFALSLVAIDVWGAARGDIWTQPKVLVVGAIAAFNAIYLLFHARFGSRFPKLDRHWQLHIGCWLSFLVIGLISTVNSPFPMRSLWGQATMGDGLAYWVLIAIFTLSNAGIVAIESRIFRYQLYGLLAG